MRVTRISTLLVSLVCLAVLSVSVASAAPTKSPNAEIYLLECDNGASFSVATIGYGDYTPGHIIDGDGRVVIPIAFTFKGFDADGNEIFSESIVKKGQRKGLIDDLITCTFGGTFEENGETFTFIGTATGFIAPRN